VVRERERDYGEEKSMSESRHPFADERFSERWPDDAEWRARRRQRVEAGAHQGTRPRGNPEPEEDKIRPRSEELSRVLGH
jgi:hypothetical protein